MSTANGLSAIFNQYTPQARLQGGNGVKLIKIRQPRRRIGSTLRRHRVVSRIGAASNAAGVTGALDRRSNGLYSRAIRAGTKRGYGRPTRKYGFAHKLALQ